MPFSCRSGSPTCLLRSPGRAPVFSQPICHLDRHEAMSPLLRRLSLYLLAAVMVASVGLLAVACVAFWEEHSLLVSLDRVTAPAVPSVPSLDPVDAVEATLTLVRAALAFAGQVLAWCAAVVVALVLLCLAGLFVHEAAGPDPAAVEAAPTVQAAASVQVSPRALAA